jgi:phage tail-like protein
MECMARRVDPYKNFRFRVWLGDVVVGGFEEVQAVTKLSGLNKSTDVTLKRGVIGAASLRDWLNRARKRTVSIEIQATDARLTLGGATGVKHNAEPLNAAGNDVAIEELVLSAERLDFASVCS